MDPSKAPQLTQTAVITLPSVNPSNVLTKYQGMHYTNLVLARTGGQQVIVNNNQMFKPVQGNSPEEPSFSYVRRSGVEVNFITTNQDLFEGVQQAARTRPLNCDWCRWPLGDEYIGTPIDMKVHYNQDNKAVYTFVCDGRGACCDEACSLAHFLHTSGGIERFNIQRHQSEYLIHTLHKLRNPQAVMLKPAHDYHLLCINGGPMSREQYKTDQKNYIRDTTTVVIKYGKAIYQQMKVPQL